MDFSLYVKNKNYLFNFNTRKIIMAESLFLIGGLDLEMQTIMAVLQNRGVTDTL